MAVAFLLFFVVAIFELLIKLFNKNNWISLICSLDSLGLCEALGKTNGTVVVKIQVRADAERRDSGR